MADGSPTGAVSITLLGGLTVTVGPRLVTTWPTRRSAELVALLALSDGRRLLRDQVVEALWPHLAPQAGAANLRKAAHFARQALGGERAVHLAEGRVSLFPDAVVDIDAALFERRARDILRSGDRAAAAALAAGCAADLLPELLYAEWTQGPRDRLRSLLTALLRLGEQWERLVAVDPADEHAHRELMRAAREAGSPHTAIRWYSRLRTNLGRRLGVAPSEESRALYESCVADLPPGPAMVGRQLELARLTAALDSATVHGSGALIVRGAAGMGKSTLCGELAATARQRRWRVTSVTAGPARGAYAALAAAVQQQIDRDPAVLDRLPATARTVLAELLAPTGPGAATTAGLTRHRVIGAVHRLLTADRGVPGVLLVVDDVHLADEATVEAAEQLARTGGAPPVRVVLAYRPEAAPPALTGAVVRLDQAGRGTVVDLGPLAEAEIAAVVESESTVAASPARVSRIVAMAEGNPFFARELARGSAGGGDAVRPSTWVAIIERTLDLDEATAALVRRLAVIGDDLDPFDVPALTGLAEAEAFALLDAALDVGALVVAGTRYRFRHDLLRQALAEQVPPHRRPAIHRDAARGLAAAGAAPSLVARHWLDGGRPDEAEPWLWAAARRAWSLGAFADALGQLDPLLAHRPTHLPALRLRAEVLDALGDRRAPAAYAAAAQAAEPPETHDLRARQALAEIKQGDPRACLRTLEGLAPSSLPGRLAQALAWSGAAVMGFASPQTGTAKAAECRRLALRSGDRAALVVASWAQAAAAHARDDLRESLWADLLDTHALRELAVSVFDGHLCMTQRLLYGARPYPDVLAFAAAFREEAERLGAGRGLAFATTLRGEAELLSGALDDADADLREAARLSRDVGAATGEALALQRRAEVALHRGHHGEAAGLLDDALDIARESDVGFHLFDRIYGTRIAAATDPDTMIVRIEEAEQGVRGPSETCPGCRITLTAPAAIAAARGGDLDRAARYARDTEDLAAVVMRLPGWDATVQEVNGHLAAALGDPGRATEHFRSAATAFHGAGRPLDAARCAGKARESRAAAPRPPRPRGTFREHRPDTVSGMSNHSTTVATAVGLLNAGDVDGYVTTLYHPDAVFHGFPPDFPGTRAGIAEFFRALRAGIPDAVITAQDMLVDQDRVAVRFTLTGTHTGELFGVPAGGAGVEAEGITILHFRGDQVAERWNRLDDLAFLGQIGALPVATGA
ncbi:ester cyclase [Pseudonocardia sp. RS010]|uniref:ester cyclase n=1 Tax=Pseudonocardia sp. RS010 TaxID=3385979 RepID=UPI0039A11CF9